MSTKNVILKKTLRILRILLIVGICIVAITYISVRIWLSYRFDALVADRNYPAFVEKIKATGDLPEEVHTAYSKARGYNATISTNRLIHKIPVQLLFYSRPNHDRDNCPCLEVSNKIVSSFFDLLTVGLQLDKEVSLRKCRSYYLNNLDFLHGQIGIRNAAQFYFDKPLDSLNDKELLELCIMSKNPALYNLIENPENNERRLRELIEY